MPQVKATLHAKLYNEMVALRENEGFSSLSGALEHLVRIGLKQYQLGAVPAQSVPDQGQIGAELGHMALENIKDSLSEVGEENTSNAGGPELGQKRPTLNERQQALIPLAESVRALIAKESGREGLNRDLNKCVKTIDQIIRIDKIPESDILPLTGWQLQHPFWQANLLSVPQWRKIGSVGLPKIVVAWQRFRQEVQNGNRLRADTPTSPRPANNLTPEEIEATFGPPMEIPHLPPGTRPRHTRGGVLDAG